MNFIKTTVDLRAYREVIPDVVGVLHLQGGYVTGWGGKDLRMLDHFQMGPNLVRGFAPIGYRSARPDAARLYGLSGRRARRLDVLGRQRRIPDAAVLPAEGLRRAGRGLRRCRFALELRGPTFWSVTGERINGNADCATWGPAIANPVPCGLDNGMNVRTSVGVGLIWDSPFGPLRFDYLVPDHQGAYDRVQQFRFGGGTTF